MTLILIVIYKSLFVFKKNMIYIIIIQLFLVLFALYMRHKVIAFYKKNCLAKKYLKLKKVVNKNKQPVSFFEYFQLETIVHVNEYKANGVMYDIPNAKYGHINNITDGIFPINKYSEYDIYYFLKDNKYIAFYKKISISKY